MENTSIKDILYSEINKIGESHIQQELSRKSYRKVTKEILDRCIPRISLIGGEKYEIFGTFAESMMHYLLTNALIPSQRKIRVKDIEIDVVIPDLRTLNSNPKDAVVLYFVKTADLTTITKRIENIQEAQPAIENIWVISKSKPRISFRTYVIENRANFAKILDDISGFLSSKPQSKFRIFKS